MATKPLVVAILIAGGLVAGSVLARSIFSPKDFVATTEIDATVAASPALTPAEVVSTQMKALAKSRTEPAAIADCFALASPANKVVTGPLSRFTQMLGSPAYRPLVDCQNFLVGEAKVSERLAVVLVSLIDRQGVPHAFRFVLTKQTRQPVEDCWMTDAVLVVGKAQQGEGVEGSPADEENRSGISEGNPNAA